MNYQRFVCSTLVWLEANTPGVFYGVALGTLAVSIWKLHGSYAHARPSTRQIELPSARSDAAPVTAKAQSNGEKSQPTALLRFVSPNAGASLRLLSTIVGLVAGTLSIYFSASKFIRGDVFMAPGVCTGRVEFKANYEPVPNTPAVVPSIGYDFAERAVTITQFERTIVFPRLMPAVLLPKQFYNPCFSPGCNADEPRTRVAKLITEASLEAWPDPLGVSLGTLQYAELDQQPCDDSRYSKVCLKAIQPEAHAGTRIRLSYIAQNASLPNACRGQKARGVPFDVPNVFELRYGLPEGFWFEAAISYSFGRGTDCADVLGTWVDLDGAQHVPDDPYRGLSVWIAPEQNGPYRPAMSPQSVDPDLWDPVARDRCTWHVRSKRPSARDLIVSIAFRIADRYLPLPDPSLASNCSG
jgi:hypothetical protein